MAKYLDLVVIILYALASSALALFIRLTGAPALIIQAPIVLLLPGYTLISAALPSRTLDRLERLALSLGLSLAVTVLGGLLLNVVSTGLGTRSWSVLLSGFIIVSSAVGVLRRGALQGALQGAPQGVPQGVPQAASSQKLRLSPALVVATSAANGGSEGGSRARQSLRRLWSAPWSTLGLGLALLIIVGAIIFSNQSALHQPYPGFTQLWMLPSQASNGQSSVQVGIVNDELGKMSYTLVLKSGDKTIRRITDISLARHSTWEGTIAVVPGSQQTLIEGDLYLTGQATPVYRSVKVWISPAKGGT